MTDYRFYALDDSGKVSTPPVILKCDDDDEALSQAKNLVGEWPIEIWEGRRRVAMLRTEQ